jgi:peroxiredoxin
LAAGSAELRALGAEVAVLAPGRAEEARRLQAELHPPLPVFADPSGAALDALGFTRTGPVRRSGVVVLDAAGQVRYARRTLNPSGSLDMAELRRALGGAPA